MPEAFNISRDYICLRPPNCHAEIAEIRWGGRVPQTNHLTQPLRAHSTSASSPEQPLPFCHVATGAFSDFRQIRDMSTQLMVHGNLLYRAYTGRS